jgi:hypothetical protein
MIQSRQYIWKRLCLGKIREHGPFQVENLLRRIDNIESAMSLEFKAEVPTRLKTPESRAYLPIHFMLNKCLRPFLKYFKL